MKRKKMASPRRRYYCAGAIRGDSRFTGYIEFIVKIVRRYGEPYTERSETYRTLDHFAETGFKDDGKRIYERDVRWLRESDAVIAEVSGASTGTGTEIEKAIHVHKPVFCLYHHSSLPSLMVKHHRSKYVIVQEYSSERDLEAYLTCFMEIVTRTDVMDDIKLAYFDISPHISELNVEQIRKLTSFVGTEDLRLTEIDFRDSKVFIDFMLRNVLLQSRWIGLQSQRIGRTFVSGDKPRIIKALARQRILAVNYYDTRERYPIVDVTHSHKQLWTHGVRHSRWALTKNLRAYRRIGLLIPTGQIRYGTSKFRNEIRYEFTLPYLEKKVVSSRRPRNLANPVVRVTNHIRHLSAFLEKFGQRPLLDILLKYRETGWYQILVQLSDVGQPSIDEVRIESMLSYPWGVKLKKTLHVTCQEFWNSHFSSFIPKRKSMEYQLVPGTRRSAL